MTVMNGVKERLARMHANLARTVQTLRILTDGLSLLDEELQNARTLADNYWIIVSANGAFATEYLRVVDEEILAKALMQADDETLEKLIQALRRANQLNDDRLARSNIKERSSTVKRDEVRILPVEEEIPNIEEDFIKAPWRSRRFWIFLFVPLVAVGIAFYAPLANVREQLIESLVYLAITLVSGFSVTHAAGRVEPVWKSRRFWTAVASVVLSIGIAVYPPLANIRADLINLITKGGMALVGALTLTDLALLKGWTTKL